MFPGSHHCRFGDGSFKPLFTVSVTEQVSNRRSVNLKMGTSPLWCTPRVGTHKQQGGMDA